MASLDWLIHVRSTFPSRMCSLFLCESCSKNGRSSWIPLAGVTRLSSCAKAASARASAASKWNIRVFCCSPPLFHQQRESVIPAAQSRFDQIAPYFPPPDQLRLEFYAETATARRLVSLDDAKSLRSQHGWRNEVIAERFDWGREKAIFALAAKVFRLPKAVELPMLPAYGGCKSWVELDREIPTEAAEPVLERVAFEDKLKQFNDALIASRTPPANIVAVPDHI
jgi:hypothetical protein